MNATLPHPLAKSRHIIHWLSCALLAVLLSWAALDHLMRPDDVLQSGKRLGLTSLAFTKSAKGKVLTIARRFAAGFRSRRSSCFVQLT